MLAPKTFLWPVACVLFLLCSGPSFSQVVDDSSPIKLTGNTHDFLHSSNLAINSIWNRKDLELSLDGERIIGVGDVVLARSNGSKVTLALIEWNPRSNSFSFQNEYFVAMKLGKRKVLVKEHGSGSLLMYQYELTATKLTLFCLNHKNVKQIYDQEVGQITEVPVGILDKQFEDDNFASNFFSKTDAIRLERPKGSVEREHFLMQKRQEQKATEQFFRQDEDKTRRSEDEQKQKKEQKGVRYEWHCRVLPLCFTWPQQSTRALRFFSASLEAR
jgi:hypothetical protein